MKKYLFIIAAILMFAACSPTEVEMIEPETPEATNPDGSPADEPSEANNFNNNHYWLVYKEGKFELLNSKTKERGQFKVDEAERLLRMPNTDWTIPTDAPYLFSQANGLRFERRLIK